MSCFPTTACYVWICISSADRILPSQLNLQKFTGTKYIANSNRTAPTSSFFIQAMIVQASHQVQWNLFVVYNYTNDVPNITTLGIEQQTRNFNLHSYLLSSNYFVQRFKLPGLHGITQATFCCFILVRMNAQKVRLGLSQ